MKENVVEVFEKRLKKFRNVLFEIYVTPQKEKVLYLLGTPALRLQINLYFNI